MAFYGLTGGVLFGESFVNKTSFLIRCNERGLLYVCQLNLSPRANWNGGGCYMDWEEVVIWTGMRLLYAGVCGGGGGWWVVVGVPSHFFVKPKLRLRLGWVEVGLGF